MMVKIFLKAPEWLVKHNRISNIRCILISFSLVNKKTISHLFQSNDLNENIWRL